MFSILKVKFSLLQNFIFTNNIIISFGNMVSYIKGGIQAKGIWKQDPEANIWAQEGWELGVEKAPQWGTS